MRTLRPLRSARLDTGWRQNTTCAGNGYVAMMNWPNLSSSLLASGHQRFGHLARQRDLRMQAGEIDAVEERYVA